MSINQLRRKNEKKGKRQEEENMIKGVCKWTGRREVKIKPN